jgi:hypothetical protein
VVLMRGEGAGRVGLTAVAFLACVSMVAAASLGSASRPAVAVAADNGESAGAAVGSVISVDSTTTATVGIEDEHRFWTNLLVQQPAGSATLKPVPIGNTYGLGGLYSQLGALGPNAQAVWQWTFDPTYVPISQTVVVTPAGVTNLAASLNVISIIVETLSGILSVAPNSFVPNQSSIKAVVGLLSGLDDFRGMVDDLSKPDPTGVATHFWKLLTASAQRAALGQGLADLGLPSLGPAALDRVVPGIGYASAFIDLLTLITDMAGALLNNSAQGNITFTAKSSASPSNSPVDWKNTSYTIACPGLAAGPLTVTLRNGTGHAPADTEDSQGYDVSVVSGGLTSGDLTNDERPEEAVLLRCHPSEMGPSNVADEVQVFTEGLGGPKMLARLTPPFPNSRFPPLFDAIPGPPQEFVFSISNDRLLTTVEAWAPDDCHACSSIHREISWGWDGTKFVPTDITPQITPTTDILALLQKMAMQKCQASDYAQECTPGGAKISKADPLYGIGIADATGGHGIIYKRPSTSSTAFVPVMNIGGDDPTCSQVETAGVPTPVFTELLGLPCLLTRN